MRVEEGEKLIVVVSAMGKTTNNLIDLANQVSSDPLPRELDMLLATGEQTSAALLSMSLNDLGVQAVSYNAFQRLFHFASSNILERVAFALSMYFSSMETAFSPVFSTCMILSGVFFFIWAQSGLVAG